MSIHFASMTVSQITDRAHKLMEEGNALARLAGALAEFEESTGRKLFVSEADQGTSYVGTAAPVEIVARPDPVLTVPATSGNPDIAGTSQGKAVAAKSVLAEGAAAKPEVTPSTARTEPLTVKGKTTAPDLKPVKKPAPKRAAAPTAAPVATTPPTTARTWGALSLPERAIVKHLERLPATFTPQEDLTLAELLIGGNRVEAVAPQFEVSADQALTRWKGFLCSEVLGANCKPSIDGQQRLLAALRYRVETAA